jgi:hypothetical protein
MRAFDLFPAGDALVGIDEANRAFHQCGRAPR